MGARVYTGGHPKLIDILQRIYTLLIGIELQR